MAGYEILGRAIPAAESRDKHYWGVHSVTRVDAPVMQGDCRTFFKLIADRAGPPPQYWGRYIGHSVQIYNLGPSEIPYLASQNCRIVLIYAGLRDLASATGETNGIAKANDAINLAQGLGVPRGVYIYLDAEPTSGAPDYGFYKGWFNTFQSPSTNPSGYKAGAYLPTPTTTSFPPYCDAYAGSTTDPSKPVVPALRSIPALTYTVKKLQDCNTDPGFGQNHPNFDPALPQCGSPLVVPPTVIHHYELNCPVFGANSGQNIDMDLAKIEAFRGTWAPPAPLFQERAGIHSVSDTLDWKWIWLGSFAIGPEGSYFTTHCPGQWRGYNRWGLGQTSDPTANPLDCPASPSTNHPPAVSASWTNFGFSIPANATIVGIGVYASGTYFPQSFGPYIVTAAGNLGPTDSCADWIWGQDITDTLYVPGRGATVNVISGSKSGSMPLGALPGPNSCVYGTAGGLWDGITWTPADINTGFLVSIIVPNYQWVGPGSGQNFILSRNNCNCMGGFWNCPDNKPAELPTTRLGLTVTKARVYFR